MNWFEVVKYREIVKPTKTDRLRRWDYEQGQKFYTSKPYIKMVSIIHKLSTMKYSPKMYKFLQSIAYNYAVNSANNDKKQHDKTEIKRAMDKLEMAWKIDTGQTQWNKILGWFGI